MCDHWGKDNRTFRLMRDNTDYKAYMTYLKITSRRAQTEPRSKSAERERFIEATFLKSSQ